MSSQTINTIADELQQASYKAVLLQIVHGLEKQQQEELRFYYDGLIPGETTGTLNILRSLENAAMISWMDVSSLKESMCVIGRNDLAETLTAYEIKRNLKVLFDIYASKRRRSQSQCYSSRSVELVAGRLVKATTERIDQAVRSLMESRENIQEVLNGFEEEIEHELEDPWDKLTLLVIITNKAILMANEEGRLKPEFLKFCSTAAIDKLCSRMMVLGTWKDFCGHVEERYNLVHPQHNSDVGNAFMEQIAEVVQQFKTTTFFQQPSSPQSFTYV